MSKSGNLRRTTRELGLLNAMLYWSDRIAGAISGDRLRVFKYRLVAQPVPPRRLLKSNRGVSVREITAATAPGHVFPRPAGVIAQRFAQGGRCLMAENRSGFAGYLWFNLGPYQEDEVRCRFVPHPADSCAWDYDVYVAPAHRLGFVFARLWDEANAEFRQQQVAWTLSRISAFNPDSLASHQRMACKQVGSATFVRLGPAQIMLATVSPYFHLGWGSASQPKLRVRAPADVTEQ